MSYKHEAICSILSYIRIEPEPKSIIILTDNTEVFHETPQLNPNIILEYFSTEKIRSWLYPYINYMPRLKILALKYITDKYDGNIILFDTDTFFMSSPNVLFDLLADGKIIMHSRCMELPKEAKEYKCNTEEYGILSGAVALSNLLKKNKNIFNKEILFNPATDEFFNSGVVGIPKKHYCILSDALKLSDLIFNEFEFWNAEEMAFSIVLEHLSDINTCDNIVYHYYSSKLGRLILSEYLAYNNEQNMAEYEDAIKKYQINRFEEIENSFNNLPYFMFFVCHYLPRILLTKQERDEAAFNSVNAEYSEIFNPVIIADHYVHRESFQGAVISNLPYYKKTLTAYKVISNTKSTDKKRK